MIMIVVPVFEHRPVYCAAGHNVRAVPQTTARVRSEAATEVLYDVGTERAGDADDSGPGYPPCVISAMRRFNSSGETSSM